MKDKEVKKVKKSVDQIKKDLEINKLKLENSQLEYQQSKISRRIEFWKSLTPLAGFITAILALLTFGFTIYKWSYEEDKKRIYEIDQKVENHISNLLSEKSSDEKHKSIILLGNYLDKNNKKYHSQILSSLTNCLNEERNPRNRNSIKEIFGRIDTLNIEKEILNSTLTTLIELSRNKNKDFKLYHLTSSRELFEDIDSSSQKAIAIDICNAIIKFLKKGIIKNDLSEIYCFNCDFTELNLPNTNFENSMLSLANFSNSNLVESNFNEADLELTKFINAKLQNAKFTTDYFKTENKFDFYKKRNYMIRQLEYGDQTKKERGQLFLYSPDFSGANLTNADFSGHLLFKFDAHRKNNMIVISEIGPHFNNAILKKTKFNNTGVFGANYSDLNQSKPNKPIYPFLPFDGYRDVHGKTINNYYYELFIYQFNDSLKLSPDFMHFPSDLKDIVNMFENSNWEEAILPEPIKYVLENVTYSK